MTRTGHRLWTVLGGVFIVGVSFWVTLLVLDAVDVSRQNANPTFAGIVGALQAGKTIVIRFDDDPAEPRDSMGRIVCGPGTGKGFLGTLVAGAEYELTYVEAKRLWTLVGPYHEAPLCQRHLETVGPFDDRPEKGQIVLWGAHMTFDRNIDVYDAANRKVGHIMRIR